MCWAVAASTACWWWPPATSRCWRQVGLPLAPHAPLLRMCHVHVHFWEHSLSQPVPRPRGSAGAKSLAPARPDLSLVFELPGLEVSVVDHRTRELLLLSASSLRASLALGSNPASSERCWQGRRAVLAAVLGAVLVPTVLRIPHTSSRRPPSAPQPSRLCA